MSAALKQDIAALLQRRDASLDDDTFNHHARRVFNFQFEHNEPYRKFCERRAVTPDGVAHWLDIPAVPTAAFKEAALVCGPPAAAQAVFRTSGTTRGSEKRGHHYVLDLQLYDWSLLNTFETFMLPAHTGLPIVSLVPAWQPESDSSLAYMVTTVMRELGAPQSWYAISDRGIEIAALHDWLHAVTTNATPICIVGTSLAFMHWFDGLRAQKLAFRLPPGSRIMDTGGFKGAQRSITSAELRAQYTELLGVDARHVVNEYGMTEMLSQYYDAHLADAALMGIKRGPPWVRYAVVDAQTLTPVPAGATGLLRHFDLANLFSVAAIQTEDVGRLRDGGFELLGRTPGATPRGCSIALDMFLSATRA